MIRNVLFEASPVNPVTKLPETVRFSRVGIGSAGTQLDGFEWKPVITAGPSLDASVFSQGRVARLSPNYGNISFYLDANHGTRILNTYAWDGALARIWVGDVGQPFSTYTKIFEGSCGAQSQDKSVLRVSLMGTDAVLDETDFLTATYSGIGGINGSSDIKGQFKPVSFGECLNITSKLIDPVNRVFQVNDGAVLDIPAIYEGAIPLTKMMGTYSTYAGLIGATLAPDEWAKAPALGLFRMGGENSLPLTVDVYGALDGSTYVSSLSTILPLILKKGGISPSKIDQASFDAFADYSWSYHNDAQETVGDIVNSALATVGAYMFTNTDGVIEAASWFGAVKAELPLNTDRTTEIRIIPQSMTQDEAWPPNYSIRIGADRNWTEMASGDVSGAINTIAEDQQALNDAYLDLKEQADQTAADAALLLVRYEDMAADGILSRDEKARVILDWQKETAVKPRVNNSATNYGLTALNATYNSAYADLSSYLGGLYPAWDNTSVNTPIDRTVWNNRWKALEDAKVAVEQEAAKVAGTKAVWSQIADDDGNRPEDGATVGGTVGEGGNVKNPDGTPYVPIAFEDVEAEIATQVGHATDIIDAQLADQADDITEMKAGLADAVSDIADEVALARANENAINLVATHAQTTADGVAASLTSTTTILTNADTALGNRSTALEAQMAGTTASGLRTRIADEETVRTSQTGALATRANTLEAQMAGTQTSNLSSRIATVETATTDGRFAAASRATSLESRATAVENQLAGTATSNLLTRITDEVTTRTSQTGALATRANTLEAQMAGTTASNLSTRIATVETATTDGRFATSSRATNLEARATTLENQLAGSAGSNMLTRIQTVETATTDGRFAAASRAATLEAQMAGSAGSNLLTRISTVETATTDGRFATASSVSTLNSTVGGLSSTVSTQAGTIATLQGRAAAYLSLSAVAGNGRAQLTLKADANGGGGVDIVGDTTFSGKLNIGPTSGQRVNLDDAGMRVYDSSNVMRVRVGIW